MSFLLIKKIKASLLNLVFPHACEGCGNEVGDEGHFLCLQCLAVLPFTQFEQYADNPFEKIFYGRLNLASGFATCYFTKNSVMQHLMHQFKYTRHKNLGIYLGRLMGNAMQNSKRFSSVDILIPLPLFAGREKERGFNQSAILCEGISQVTGIKILNHSVIRNAATESQTRKGRIARWQNMKDRFEVIDAGSLEGKHLLLIDDVITTGSTLEACGSVISTIQNVTLSMATLCFSAKG